jgi:hypothetical protein
VDTLIGLAERAEAGLESLDHLEGDAALFFARPAANGAEGADLCHHLVETGSGLGIGGVAHGSVVARILGRRRAAVQKNQIVADAASSSSGNLRKDAKRRISM